MIFEDRARGTRINWPGAKPPDEVQLPTEPAIVRLLEEHKCTVKLTHNAFELVNDRGDAMDIPYSATLAEWEEAVNFLANFDG